MRTLVYVPIIHTIADLGSMSKEITERGIATLGEEAWARHQTTIAGFWRSIWEYCDGIDATDMKIYQDGMVADGPLGRKVAEDAAAAGSLNYQLVLKLLCRGARLVKTEDFDLVKQEYDKLMAIVRARSIRSKLFAVARYRLIKTILLRKRDAFVARRIHDTLESDETGILFIGALHDIVGRLASDIRIEQIKDVQRVRDYQKLLPLRSRHTQRFEELGRYLVVPVSSRLSY